MLLAFYTRLYHTPTLTLRTTSAQRLAPRLVAILELHHRCLPSGRTPSYGTVLLAHPLTCMVKERDTDTHPGIGRYTPDVQTAFVTFP